MIPKSLHSPGNDGLGDDSLSPSATRAAQLQIRFCPKIRPRFASAKLDHRDLPGEAAGFVSAADDALPTAELRFYPAPLVVRLLNHATVVADLGNMAIPHTEGLFHGLMLQGANGLPQKILKI